MLALGVKILQTYQENSAELHNKNMAVMVDKGDHMQNFALNMAAASLYHTFRFDILIAIEAALIWIKFIFMFENTKTFGPTIKIIQVMARKMMEFLTVWSMVIVAFACTGLLMFAHNESFNSITGTFYFLICAALGNWDANVFEIENWDVLVKHTYLTNNDIYTGKIFLLIF